MKQRQSGFSLVEMLVVIAIIGIISLVTVPNFIALRKSNMLKNSMRGFINDIRGARQRAVTRHEQTKIVFSWGSANTGRQYTVWEQPPGSATWALVGNPRQFEETCYISTSANIPTPDSGATYELVFKSDGTPVLNTGTFQGTATVKTDANIPVNWYLVTVQVSGSVKASSPLQPTI